MSEIEIRQAQPGEASKLLPMMRLSHKETALPFPEIDELDVMRWLVNTIGLGGSAVAVADGLLVGSLGVGIRQYQWNTKVEYLVNEWFYVLPSFRKRGVATKLLEKAKQLSDRSGRSFILGITSGKKGVDRFAAIQGFTYMGGNMFYEGKNHDQSLRGEDLHTDLVEEPGMAG